MKPHSYYINKAKAAAEGSKDPSTKVGCIIVDKSGATVSDGYNGMVAEADESKFTWDRPLKYYTVIHAEINAVLFAKRDLTGCIAYVTDAPCNDCLKVMLQAKIREIYYEDCSIMRDRGTTEQKWAIKALIEATGAKVYNINGRPYLEELHDNSNK